MRSRSARAIAASAASFSEVSLCASTRAARLAAAQISATLPAVAGGALLVVAAAAVAISATGYAARYSSTR